MERRGSPFGRRGNLYRNWRRGETRRAVNAVGQGMMLQDGNEDEEQSDEYDSASETHEDIFHDSGLGPISDDESLDEFDYDTASEVNEEVFHDWNEGEEPDLEEPCCVFCYTEHRVLMDSIPPVRFFQDKFCECRGHLGRMCETCIKETAKWEPDKCNVCKYPWRNLRFIRQPMNYEQFLVWAEKLFGLR